MLLSIKHYTDTHLHSSLHSVLDYKQLMKPTDDTVTAKQKTTLLHFGAQNREITPTNKQTDRHTYTKHLITQTNHQSCRNCEDLTQVHLLYASNYIFS